MSEFPDEIEADLGLVNLSYKDAQRLHMSINTPYKRMSLDQMESLEQQRREWHRPARIHQVSGSSHRAMDLLSALVLVGYVLLVIKVLFDMG